MSKQSIYLSELHGVRRALIKVRRASIAKASREETLRDSENMTAAMQAQQMIDFVDEALRDEENLAVQESANEMASHVEALARETPEVDPD